MRLTRASSLSAALALLLAAAAAGAVSLGRTAEASRSHETAATASPASSTPAASEGRALLDQFSQAFHQAAQEVNPAVVAIVSEQQVQATSWPGPFPMPWPQQPSTRKAKGLGSGVIVSSDGYILTNDHVVRNASKLTVEIEGKKRAAQVVGTDPQSDLAVIKVEARDLPVASLGNSDELQVGQWVIAVGNPLELRHSVTAGIISATGRSSVGLAPYEDFIQTDASINPGNSGGALADLDGRVVGINTAIASPNGGNIGIGFAIPINMARRVMDELIEDGRISRGYLGVTPQDLDPELAGALGVESDHGALVGDVAAGGPAERAGVERGDVIVSFNGHDVAGAVQLRNLVADGEPGSEARVVVLRDGRRHDLQVELGQRPDMADARPVPGGREESPGNKLGLSVQPLTADLAQRLGYEDAHGILVTAVEPGGPADEAGIEPRDLIVAVGREEVHSVDELRRALAGVRGDAEVALVVRRGEATRFVAVHVS
jgi:serine protease Do